MNPSVPMEFVERISDSTFVERTDSTTHPFNQMLVVCIIGQGLFAIDLGNTPSKLSTQMPLMAQTLIVNDKSQWPEEEKNDHGVD